jgi:hypothetical protein
MTSLIDIQTAHFRASDMEIITEVNPNTVGAWKSRGFLHNNAAMTTHGGYSLHDVALILLLGQASRQGLSVKTFYGHGSAMARHVVANAFEHPNAWDTADNWQVYMHDKRSASPMRYGIINDNQIVSVPDLDAYYRRNGPIASSVFSLEALGQLIVERAPNWFATLRIHDLVERDGQSMFINRATGEPV